MKLGIYTLKELREYLEGTTDNGGVTVNRGFLRQLLLIVDQLPELLEYARNATLEEDDEPAVVTEIEKILEALQ